MADVTSLNVDLQSQDEGVVGRALEKLTEASLSSLDAPISKSIYTQCVDKLASSSLAIRGKSLVVLVRLLESGDGERTRPRGLAKQLEGLTKMLVQPSMLDLGGTTDSDDYILYHASLCRLISRLQNQVPKTLLQQGFKTLAHYLVECTAHTESKVAAAATEYWGKLKIPPVPAKSMDAWVPCVLSRLQKLLKALLRNMIYHEKHMEYLESGNTGSNTPPELEAYSDLRNYAALAFENICQIFQNEATAVFKPLLMKRLDSDNWLEVEGILLALSAFTQALGIPRDMQDIYPHLLQRLLQFYSHPKPLVRAITCFTLQHFVNKPMKGVKDPFVKMIKCNSALLTDSCPEVQVMAARSLANMMAYAERDIVPHLQKVLASLTSVSSTLQGEARYPFYECVGHLFGRMAPVLEASDTEKLLEPIMNHWQSLILDPTIAGSADEVMMVCQPLCIIAIYAKDAFQPYNDRVLEKVSSFLGSVTQNGLGQHLGDSLTTMLVAILDLTSAVFEGQGQRAAAEAKHHNLAPVCLTILQTPGLDAKVHQSALAVVGHLSQYTYDEVRPLLSGILSIIRNTLDAGSVDDGLKNNALWTLGIMAKCESSQNDQIFSMVGQLVDLVKQTDGDMGCVINAALAFTNLCAKWPEQTIQALVKGEIFHYLCSLMQTQFPRDQERDTIFKNLCTLLAQHMKKVDRENWTTFCIAAAMLDTQDEDLLNMLRHLLKELRNLLGNKGWNKVCQEVGPQLAIILRKRYKLY